MGIGQDIWREANHMLEIRFWVRFPIGDLFGANISQNPDEDNRLYRSDMIVDTMPGISRFQQATLHQGMKAPHTGPKRSLIPYNQRESKIIFLSILANTVISLSNMAKCPNLST